MDRAKPPLVSILIRSMDRPTLDRALRSVAAQTWPNLEIVVVAACGSRHRSLPDMFGGRPLRMIVPDGDRPLARAEAANACLDAARGEWLNFLDDDDEFLPQHLTTLLNALPLAGERIVYSSTHVLDSEGKELGRVSHAGNHVQLYFHSRATSCATLIQRSLIEEGARFDPDFPVHEDHDFLVNCATRTEFRFVDMPTCIWHAQSGESGCGFGANDNPAQREQALAKIRRKWSRVFDLWFQDTEAVLYTGQQYLKGGDLPVALMCLEYALKSRPDDVNALNLCGMANFRSGNTDRAELLLGEASRRLPEHRGLRENLALVRSRRTPTAQG